MDAANGGDGPLTTGELTWCTSQIATSLGQPVVVREVRAVQSRLTQAARITVETGAGPRRFYVKRYPVGEPRESPDLASHFAALQGLAAAFRSTDAVPYAALACLPDARLGLVGETPGEPVAVYHRAILFSPRARAISARAWRGVGVWLRTLHDAAPPRPSGRRPRELVDYCVERLHAWGEVDPAERDLTERAERAVVRAGELLAAQAPSLVPCHGDVSSHNIMVGAAVGLIDLDDLRFDFPGVDVSQALLEIRQFSRFAGMVPAPGVRTRLERAFLDGYGGVPRGPAFWLPHLRNLAVFGLTLARQPRGLALSTVSTRAHYRSVGAELRRTAAAVER